MISLFSANPNVCIRKPGYTLTVICPPLWQCFFFNLVRYVEVVFFSSWCCWAETKQPKLCLSKNLWTEIYFENECIAGTQSLVPHHHIWSFQANLTGLNSPQRRNYKNVCPTNYGRSCLCCRSLRWSFVFLLMWPIVKYFEVKWTLGWNHRLLIDVTKHIQSPPEIFLLEKVTTHAILFL